MNYLKSFCLLLFATASALAQNPDKALLRVKYDFSHMLDTNQRQDFYKETMLLITGKNASVFLSYDKIMNDVEAKKSFEEQVRQQGGDVKFIKSPPRKRQFSDIEYYHFANEGEFYTKESLGIMYLTARKLEKVDWKITPEKSNIEGIQCNKATANFKGRNWIAWFSEDLPFASGPWRLGGLPGLIIQAYDENREVIFEFAGLEKVDESQKPTNNKRDEYTFEKFGNSHFLTTTEIKLPEKTVKASVEEINRLKEARAKDPQGFAKTQMAAMGFGGLTRISPPGSTSATPSIQPQKFNNPIEKK